MLKHIKTRIALRISFIAPIWLLSSCAPMVENYYEPSTEELVAHKQTCHNEVGPLTEIDFDLGNGRIAVSANHSSDHPERASLKLRYTVAWNWEVDGFKRRVHYKGEESILNIRPSEFAAYGATSEIPLKITPGKIREVIAGKGVEQSLSPVLQLTASSLSHGDTWFILYFDIELNGGHEFSVVVPQFTVDGKTNVSRTIKFTEKKGIWLTPLNC